MFICSLKICEDKLHGVGRGRNIQDQPFQEARDRYPEMIGSSLGGSSVK